MAKTKTKTNKKTKSNTTSKNEITQIKKATKKINKAYKKSSNGGKIAIICISVIAIVAAFSVAAYIYGPTIIENLNKPNNDSNNDKNNDKNDENQNNNENKNNELGEVNVANTISRNDTFTLDNDSVFYQYDSSNILSYYKDIDFSSSKENLTSSLFNLLKKDFNKLDYSGKNSKYNSSNWANYILCDRDYDASPLKEEEVTNNKWSTKCEIDLLYSSKNIDLATASSGLGTYADREHIYPKSYGFNTKGSEDYKELNAGCDLHNLWAADKNGNQTSHNNRLYDDVKDENNANSVIDRIDGSTTTYYTDSYFEPNEEDKGIIARACLYMAIRYNEYYVDENNIENPRLSLSDDATQVSSSFNPSYTKVSTLNYGKLSTLLKWNNEHPVSEHEKTRNNLVYNLQGNRNPFIDYPNLANILFTK